MLSRATKLFMGGKGNRRDLLGKLSTIEVSPFNSPLREQEQSYLNADQFKVSPSIFGDPSPVHVMSHWLDFTSNKASLWPSGNE